MDKPSDWVVLTQLLFKNDYMTGLKWTQNRLEIKNQTHKATIIIKRWTFINKQFNPAFFIVIDQFSGPKPLILKGSVFIKNKSILLKYNNLLKNKTK